MGLSSKHALLEIEVKLFVIKSAFGMMALALIANCNLNGQEADQIAKGKQLAASLLEVRENEFVPLQKETSRISALFYAKQSAQSQIAKTLKEMDADSLAKVQTSIAEAKLKLAALEELEKHLAAVGKDESLKAGLIKTAEENIEKIKLERSAAYKPVNDKRSAAYKKYKDDCDELAEIVKSCVKQEGEHELTKGTKVKYNSFSAEYARSSTSFYDEHGQKIQMQVTLFQESKPSKKLGNFLGKYPIAKKDSWGGYTFHVGSAEVKITYRIKEWKQDQVEAATDDLVDFERLELLVPGK